MNPKLFRLKELILLFKLELTDWIIWEQDKIPVLSARDPLKPWEKAEAYSWIFFEPHYLSIWGRSDETGRQLCSEDLPQALLKYAEDYHTNWGMKKVILHGCPSSQSANNEVHKYKTWGIPKPLHEEPLIRYLERLRGLITEDLYSKKIWRESLGSFLEYLKANIPPECHGYIDMIFPQDRAICDEQIIRLIPKTKFPTNIIHVSEILKLLSDELLWGDPRSQYGAAETLALAWLCLLSARLRMPTGIKMLYEFDASSLTIEKNSKNTSLPNKYYLKIPTLLGPKASEISHSQYAFFFTLSKINLKTGVKDRFFKLTERGLRKILARAVSKLNLLPQHGEITFLTLTSWPTEVLHHRTQIDNKRYSIK